MTDTDQAGGAQLQQDWETILHSELAAKAVDREVLEGLAISAKSWSTVIAAFQELMDAGKARNGIHGSDPQPPAGTGTPSRAAPAGPAPGAGEPEIDRLRRRVAELERRLADIDRAPRADKRRKPGA